MKSSKLSIFGLQKKLSRPGTTVVFSVFVLAYFVYLTVLLGINMHKGWFATHKMQGGELCINEVYTFEYYFRGSENSRRHLHSVDPLSGSTTPFLVRSETVFITSLFAMVIPLTLARQKARKSGDTLRRLSLSNKSIFVMQWLSDFANTLCLWLSHLTVIFAFYIVYICLAPIELTYPQNLYALFAGERYLYMLFPVLNPVSLARMLPLILAVSFLPSVISSFFENSLRDLDLKKTIPRVLFLIGLICWGYYDSWHVRSIIVCVIALVAGLIVFISGLPKGDAVSA